MPYKISGGKWRAKVIKDGKAYTAVFQNKKQAKEWEVKKKMELHGLIVVVKEMEQAQEKQAQACEESQLLTDMRLLATATAYLEYVEQRYHKTTLLGKAHTFRKWFFPFVKEDAMPEDVTPLLAQKIVMTCAKETTNANANQRRKHLRAWWQYCVKYYGYPEKNPFGVVDKLPENSEPHYVPPVEDFWAVYDLAKPDDKVMLLALLYTAGRRSEPFRWTWDDDINLDERRIRLSTCKTADGSRKYEWLTMPDRLYKALRDLKERSSHEHVFVSYKGQPYKTRSKFLLRLCAEAGVKPFNYHGVRGLCASLLAREGVPMKEIQHVLMHASMTTTDIYIRRIGGTDDILASAFNAFDRKREKAHITTLKSLA